MAVAGGGGWCWEQAGTAFFLPPGSDVNGTFHSRHSFFHSSVTSRSWSVGFKVAVATLRCPCGISGGL